MCFALGQRWRRLCQAAAPARAMSSRAAMLFFSTARRSSSRIWAMEYSASGSCGMEASLYIGIQQAITPARGTTMSHASARVPTPANEPVQAYAPGSPERAELKKTLTHMATERIEIPLIIGGQALHTGKLADVRMPHDHGQVLASFHQAEAPQLQAAIEAALAAKPAWEARSEEHTSELQSPK